MAMAAPFTVEAWVYPTSSSVDGVAISCLSEDAASPKNDYGWVLWQYGGSGFLWQMFKGSSYNTAVGISTGAALTANTWCHVALVWTGSTASIYVNGVLKAGPTAGPGYLPRCHRGC